MQKHGESNIIMSLVHDTQDIQLQMVFHKFDMSPKHINELCHNCDSTETGTYSDENQENINLVFHKESEPVIIKIYTRHCHSIFKKTNNNNN